MPTTDEHVGLRRANRLGLLGLDLAHLVQVCRRQQVYLIVRAAHAHNVLIRAQRQELALVDVLDVEFVEMRCLFGKVELF